MTMIEKVARAIAAERNSPGWQAYLITAYDAIKAMRDPTPAMLDAGDEMLLAIDMWKVMIDAALGDKTK